MNTLKSKNTMKKDSRKRVQLHFKNPSKTKQSFKQECDINHIINRFSKTGQIPLTNPLEKQYGFAPETDLKKSLDLIHELRHEFENLDPEIKSEFNNNSHEYAAFLDAYEQSPESFLEKPETRDDTLLFKTPKESAEEVSGTPDEVKGD